MLALPPVALHIPKTDPKWSMSIKVESRRTLELIDKA
jgi:hypothetical protein